MKIWALSAAVAATVAVVACGNGGTTTSATAAGTGGTTGTTMHVSSTSHTTGVTSGTGGTGTGGAPGMCGSTPYTKVAACEAVVEAQCCSELMNCDVGTMCNDFIKCANACQPGMSCDATCSACIKGCETSKATGFNDYQTLTQCYNQKAAAQPGCGTEICMSKILEADPVCGMCLGADATCCAAFTACAKDMPCGACFATPSSAACKANMKFQATEACQNGTACGPKCAGVICDSGLGYPHRPACNYCLGQSDAADAGAKGCCQEMDACKNDAECLKCITGMEADQTKCTANVPFGNFNTCSSAKCATECM